MRIDDEEKELFDINDGNVNQTNYLNHIYQNITLFLYALLSINTLFTIVINFLKKEILTTMIVFSILFIFILLWFT